MWIRHIQVLVEIEREHCHSSDAIEERLQNLLSPFCCWKSSHPPTPDAPRGTTFVDMTSMVRSQWHGELAVPITGIATHHDPQARWTLAQLGSLATSVPLEHMLAIADDARTQHPDGPPWSTRSQQRQGKFVSKCLTELGCSSDMTFTPDAVFASLPDFAQRHFQIGQRDDGRLGYWHNPMGIWTSYGLSGRVMDTVRRLQSYAGKVADTRNATIAFGSLDLDGIRHAACSDADAWWMRYQRMRRHLRDDGGVGNRRNGRATMLQCSCPHERDDWYWLLNEASTDLERLGFRQMVHPSARLSDIDDALATHSGPCVPLHGVACLRSDLEAAIAAPGFRCYADVFDELPQADSIIRRNDVSIREASDILHQHGIAVTPSELRHLMWVDPRFRCAEVTETQVKRDRGIGFVWLPEARVAGDGWTWLCDRGLQGVRPYGGSERDRLVHHMLSRYHEINPDTIGVVVDVALDQPTLCLPTFRYWDYCRT